MDKLTSRFQTALADAQSLAEPLAEESTEALVLLLALAVDEATRLERGPARELAVARAEPVFPGAVGYGVDTPAGRGAPVFRPPRPGRWGASLC